jgi:hypothetical protein
MSPIRFFSSLALLIVVSFAGAAYAQPQPGQPEAIAPPEAMMSPAASGACDTSDLVRTGRASGTGLEGLPNRLQDGSLLQEGMPWDSAGTVKIKADGKITIDLREVRTVQHFLVQGDDNDNFHIQGSIDGVSFTQIWLAPPSANGQGLRTRWGSSPKPVQARFLRILPSGGDGFYSLSEVRAYCAEPKPWPPALTYPPKKYGWAAIDNPMMVLIKGITAALGTLLLLWYWLARKRPQKFRRTRDVSLAFLGLFSFFSWWNLGHFHFDHYIHIWEHYHYYIGAKYGPELRYSRLYVCTAVADMEDGLRARVKKRKIRDLAKTNELGTADEIIKDPEICKSHFTPARWEDFKKDNRFFRGRFSADRWDQSQNDHGYNGTPVWAIAGRLLTDNFGELDWKKVERIGYIDSALLVMMWGVVWWAFGWRASCVALLYWGTNFPARFYWNGGSMLRYDWIVWLVVGVCLLKKEKHFGAGLALTYATLLRIFPGFVVLAIILKVLYRMFRERRFVLSRDHQIFAAGCITALLILIPLSGWAMDYTGKPLNGLDAWPQFVQNSEKHLKTALTNNMGLKTVLGYDFPTRAIKMRDDGLTDPFKNWKNAREHYYDASKPVMLGLLLLYAFMLGRAGYREPDWVAAALGTGMIVMASELTCYYYGFLLTFGLLWDRHKWPAIISVALAGLTCALSEIPWNDDHFAAMSLATVLALLASTWMVAFAKKPEELTQEPAEQPHRITPLPPASDLPLPTRAE